MIKDHSSSESAVFKSTYYHQCRMTSIENGVSKDEIKIDMESGKSSRKMRLMDYIPNCCPAVDDNTSSTAEKQFQSHRLQCFHVPFVRSINWKTIAKFCKKWIKNPANIALSIWFICVAAGLLLLFLLMTGMLDQAIPSSSRREDWNEITNQMLNALFTIMCLYQHPRLFHQLIILKRWELPDKIVLRKMYCKYGVVQSHERAHMLVILVLLHITCFAQYTLIGLYWGFNRHNRPDWPVTLCIVLGIATPVSGFVYARYGPLSKKNDVRETGKEPQQCQVAKTPQEELRVYNKRVLVTSPAWIGRLFDCRDDLRVFCLSFFCTFCLFGGNMQRLGFGNKYVHIVTFILLCIAPFVVFGITALNITDSTTRYIFGFSGILVAIFGLLYGGFWRIKMRKKFNLPPNPLCCGYPTITDCVQWLFCWSCSLAQEVKTGNFYDIDDDGFYLKATDEDGHAVLPPLPRENGSGFVIASSIENLIRSYSWPLKSQPYGQQTSADNLKEEAKAGELKLAFGRSSTCSKVHNMATPLPQAFMVPESISKTID